MIEKLGGMEPIVIVLIILYLVVKELVIPMYRKARGKPIHAYNPHVPGTAPSCIKHGEELSSIRTDISNFKEHIYDMKLELKEVRGVATTLATFVSKKLDT